MKLKTDKKKQDLRIVFMGSPEFALPSLCALHGDGFNVVAVVTQPDKKTGRGHKMKSPPVKVCAQELGIEVFQFERTSRDGVEALASLEPDLLVTCAFGHILSREILAIPKLGCVNVHGSLLPKYRGAAPIEWAIIKGESVSGITTMLTAYELDAGDMLLKSEVEIEGMTGGQLRDKLSIVGAELLVKTLNMVVGEGIDSIPQDEAEATYFPMFERGFGQVDFSMSCRDIKNLALALDPAPGMWMAHGDAKIKLFCPEIVSDDVGTCGQFVCSDSKNGLHIQAGDGVISFAQIQAPGTKRMNTKDFLRGRSL